jgi:hypothetical protein
MMFLQSFLKDYPSLFLQPHILFFFTNGVWGAGEEPLKDYVSWLHTVKQ